MTKARLNTEITGYKVDGKSVPLQGVGSLIRFDGPDEGLLHRAERLLQQQFILRTQQLIMPKSLLQ